MVLVKMKDFTDYIYKGMTDLFELKSIVGLDDSKNSVLVTLVDGRCALVDLKKRVFVVEILLDSFYKWMEFPNSPSKDNLESVKKYWNIQKVLVMDLWLKNTWWILKLRGILTK